MFLIGHSLNGTLGQRVLSYEHLLWNNPKGMQWHDKMGVVVKDHSINFTPTQSAMQYVILHKVEVHTVFYSMCVCNFTQRKVHSFLYALLHKENAVSMVACQFIQGKSAVLRHDLHKENSLK